MRFFFEYRTYIIVLLLVLTLLIYWHFGIFANEAVNGMVKSVPFIVIMILAMIPTPGRYRGD